MIIQPPLDKLMEKVDSRYTLVIATAKRARQLTDDPEKKTDKPVIDAVQDIIKDNIELDYSGESAKKAEEVVEEESVEETAEEAAQEVTEE